MLYASFQPLDFPGLILDCVCCFCEQTAIEITHPGSFYNSPDALSDLGIGQQFHGLEPLFPVKTNKTDLNFLPHMAVYPDL